MTFVHPLVLALAGLPLIWIAWAGSRTTRRPSLILKALSVSSIALALAQPEWKLPQAHTAVLALVDTSNSISSSDLERASAVVRQMEAARGSNWLRVVPFAAAARTLLPEETQGRGLRFVHASDGSADTTSLEAVLTSSAFALPENRIPRVALLTDGNENEGSTARAMAELGHLHIPVDVIPLGEHNMSAFQLASVSLPPRAYAGEQIPIDIAVNSPAETDARVELFAESKTLGSSPVHLQPGVNQLRVHARLHFAGAAVIAGKVAAPQMGELAFRQGIEMRKARVLYLSQDPPGSDTNLLNAFQQAGYEVSRDASRLSGNLRMFQLVVLNNLDLNNFAADAKDRLETYVKNGGGLLLIGGERQVYKEGKKMDALDRALPAQLAPPKSPEGTCVALIIDKSSSMEGRKIELARLSAIGVVDHLRPLDYIGVLIFDNSFQWAVPVRRAEDKTLIKRLISGITPDGGTQIAPALTEAYRRILPSKATFKHIVLLTDGISEEGDSLDLAHEAVGHGITISTVGLGQDVNRTYLEKIAVTSGGKSYFLNDPAGLEQILLKDVKDYSGSTAVEKPLVPLVTRKAEVLDGIDLANAPALKGYARFTSKRAADTLLEIDPDKKDPLYVRWQYGLGRAAVFTSDAKSRWAEAWVNWPGYDTFWINVTRDLLAHSGDSEAAARFDPTSNEIAVTYRLAGDTAAPIPAIFALGPAGFRKAVPLREVSTNEYRGSVPIGNTRGLFRIRPAVDSDQFLEVGLYRGEDELLLRSTNTRLLRQIASFTGGRYNPTPASVFDAGGRTLYTVLHLWPVCLAFAIALTIAELVSRKWPALLSRFSRA